MLEGEDSRMTKGFSFDDKRRKWKVGDKWDDRRYVAQGKYYARIGKKKIAQKMYGKAGAIKRYKPKDRYIPTWEEYLDEIEIEPEYIYPEEVEEEYYTFRVDFDIRFEKES